MSIERVREAFEARGIAQRIREFPVSSATVPLAARALGVREAQIAKTLSFRGSDGGALLVVAAGDARVDNRKFRAAFGFKARMLSAQEAERLTGHAVGGVCPFALREGVRVCLDRSLQRFDLVYPACGSANSAIDLSPEALAELSGGQWVDVCRLPGQDG